MPYFHPLLKPTLWFIPAFAFLIGLGIWQLERLQWKEGLIAEMNSHMHAASIDADAALKLGDAAQYRRVALTGTFDNAKEAYAFTTGPDGNPVYHVIAPFRLSDGRVFLVDRGLIPTGLRDPQTRQAGQHTGTQNLAGIWRTPDAPGLFTPSPDAAHRVWYARDVAGIAKADGVKLAAPVIIEADPTPNPGGWPKGGQTVVDLPNSHLEYAITWFGLAAGLLGVFLAFHVSKGRLGWR
ncbi:MAG TPA: SURF1 family protein [Rhizomicrobium sp.]|jgi:surfeit locus 1 family protein|nr:SURF1 family protein [Rhizomicrobium sp.]